MRFHTITCNISRLKRGLYKDEGKKDFLFILTTVTVSTHLDENINFVSIISKVIKVHPCTHEG
jgi:hypothetical protein